MPLVILHHLLNVFVQLANKRGLKKIPCWILISVKIRFYKALRGSVVS
jgi:hypothetical protein